VLGECGKTRQILSFLLGPRSIAMHAGKQLFDRSHSRFLKAVELANRYGFAVSDNYALYLRKGQTRK